MHCQLPRVDDGLQDPLPGAGGHHPPTLPVSSQELMAIRTSYQVLMACGTSSQELKTFNAITLPAADSTWPLSQLSEADSKHSQLTGTDAIQNQSLRADSSKNQLIADDSK
jgi:hypothetical protein